jgi:hypothetical protein
VEAAGRRVRGNRGSPGWHRGPEGQNPLTNGDLGEHPVHHVGRELRHAAPTARGTDPPPLAGEGHETIVSAGIAVNAQEAVRQDAAAEESAKGTLDEPRDNTVAAASARKECLEPPLHGAVEGALLWAAAQVGAFAEECGGRAGNHRHAGASLRERCRSDAGVGDGRRMSVQESPKRNWAIRSLGKRPENQGRSLIRARITSAAPRASATAHRTNTPAREPPPAKRGAAQASLRGPTRGSASSLPPRIHPSERAVRTAGSLG